MHGTGVKTKHNTNCVQLC